MAQIFPNEIPPDISVTRSERAVFEALKRNLPDEYFVYYATPFIAAEKAEQGEVDFIIVHPERGMLFLECKGGGIERDHDGFWYRLKGKRREKLARTPAEQAKKQVEALITKFRKPCTRLFGSIEGRFPMSYGWALAFPLSRWDAVNIPPDVEPEIFLDQQLLDRTEELIEQAMAFWQRGRGKPSQLGLEDFHAFRHAILSPELKLVPDFAKSESSSMSMVRLTDKQAEVAELLVTSRRLMVNGGSGTGKTLLALHSAQCMAAEGKRVLLLCANSGLAQQLRVSTDAMARDLRMANEVTLTLPRNESAKATFSFMRPEDEDVTKPLHMLDVEATRALSPEAIETTTPFQQSELHLKEERWVEQLPGSIDTLDVVGLYRRAAYLLNERYEGGDGSSFVSRALEAQKFGPWDAVIVDQAHDLAPGTLLALEAGVAPGGHLTVFYDAEISQGEGAAVPRIGPVLELAFE